MSAANGVGQVFTMVLDVGATNVQVVDSVIQNINSAGVGDKIAATYSPLSLASSAKSDLIQGAALKARGKGCCRIYSSRQLDELLGRL